MMSKTATVQQLADLMGGRCAGDGAVEITGISSLDEAGPGQITWAASDQYEKHLSSTKASAVIVPTSMEPPGIPSIVVSDPGMAMAKALAFFAPEIPGPEVGVHATAIIDPSTTLGERVAIGPHVQVGAGTTIGARTVLDANVFVGADCSVGEDCVFFPSVVVRERCRIGNRVILHPHVTIGADGFGYHFTEGRFHKIPQIGEVAIEDDVEIGANSCVDRAKFGVTRIGKGTKIDNLTQIAHNVVIGPHCVIAAQTGLSGSSSLGSHVVLAGQVGLVDHVHVGDGAQVGAQSGISKNIKAMTKVAGASGAYEFTRFFKDQAHIRRLEQYANRIKDLTARVERLESSTDD